MGTFVTRSSLGRAVGTGVLVGLAIAVLVVWYGRLDTGAWQTPSRVAAPAGLVILLLVVAGWLFRSNLDGWVAMHVPVTAFLGVVVFGGVAWRVILDSGTGSRAALVVLNFAGVGGAVGVLVGLFTAKQSSTIRSLRTARDEYRDLFDGIGDTVIVHDTRGRIITANEVTTSRLGHEPSALAGRPIGDVEGDADGDRHATGDDRIVYETVHVTADGEPVPVEVSVRLVRYHDAPAVLSIARDISRRRASERELSRARDQLRALNRVLRHDIRNDMQIVLGHAELLDDHVDEAGRDHLETITDTGEHVVELTRSSRDLARTVAGETELPLEAVSLPETLRDELDRRRKAFTDAELRLEGDVPDVEVQANDLLSSVFRNLLNNAVQHSDRDDPTVTVSADLLRGPNRVRVRIADDGPGIPAELEGDIFGKGEKGIESTGTGLGLYLVESLVDHYGGEVWTEENDPRGTVVAVELPIADEDRRRSG